MGINPGFITKPLESPGMSNLFFWGSEAAFWWYYFFHQKLSMIGISIFNAASCYGFFPYSKKAPKATGRLFSFPFNHTVKERIV